MSKGLATYIVLLLLAATLVPLVNAQDVPDYEFSEELGDDLSAFGRGYVENLMLYSGTGIDLKWGSSFGGDQGVLDARLADLETAAGGPMPANATPLLVPFTEADPAFDGPAPIDHSEFWMWNNSGIVAEVNLGGVAATITAETGLADGLMAGDVLDAEGLLMVQSAYEASMFIAERLGWNGSAMAPLNLTDSNMTDTNISNGWWLPVFTAQGDINSTNGAWENVTVETEPNLGGSLVALRGLLELGNYLSSSAFLVGTDKPFPEGTDTEVIAIANAILKNVIGIYYDESTDLFLEDGDALTGNIAYAYMAMVDVSETSDLDGMGYWQGWAKHRAMRMADLLALLVDENGTAQKGVGTNIGGISYIPPYLVIPGAAGLVPQALSAATLYDAAERFGGHAYASAAEASFASLDANHWDDGYDIYVQSLLAETPSAYTGDQLAALVALTQAVEIGDVDMARYRIAQVWKGIVSTGLQLSETDTTGENYTIPEPDTNNNTLWKHNWTRGDDLMYGLAPVLAARATYDVGDHNWTVDDDNLVNTYGLMMGAVILMSMDADWFIDMGEPTYSEEYANMLVHFTREEIVAWGEEWRETAENLSNQVAELKDEIDNLTLDIAVLEAKIAALEEELNETNMYLNESLENETVLGQQVDNLRRLLEETNETVDELEEDIIALESSVQRLQEDNQALKENITKAQEQLRAEQNNVTHLKWELENATDAYNKAVLDRDAAQKEAEDTKQDYDDLQARTLLVAVACLFAGMIIVVVVLKAMKKI